MFFQVLKSKIHMAHVTKKNKNYEGSITIDETIARKANLVPHEKVLVADVENGNRFRTYVIYGESGEIQVNGAAANLVEEDDRLIVMAFGMTKTKKSPPTVLYLDEENKVREEKNVQ